MSARAAARKPGRSNLSTSSVPKMSANDSSDEEARAQMAALIDDLKEQLHKAETTSQQYQKQLDVLQIRLDEAVAEQAKLEEQIHEKDSKIEALNEQIREHPRIIREMQQAHDQELNALLKEKEQHVIKEEELQFTIQRLKESLAQREARAASDADKNVSRSCRSCSQFPWDCGTNVSQLASEAALPPMVKMDSLRLPRNWSVAHLAAIPTFCSRRTN